MNNQLIFKKGIFLRVVSWENDGDNYQTNDYYAEDKEEAFALQRLCKEVFSSSGVCMAFQSKATDAVIEEHRQANPYWQNMTQSDFLDYVSSISYDLLGASEHYDYDYRNCESADIYEVPADIYLSKIG